MRDVLNAELGGFLMEQAVIEQNRQNRLMESAFRRALIQCFQQRFGLMVAQGRARRRFPAGHRIAWLTLRVLCGGLSWNLYLLRKSQTGGGR